MSDHLPALDLPLAAGTDPALHAEDPTGPVDVTVFDPAMCCSSGVCGPGIDPMLLRVSADLGWLGKQGLQVERVNLGQEPLRFVESPEVRELLDRDGEDALPVVFLRGEMFAAGRYPNRKEFAEALGLAL
ncbi:MAG: arsenite efflux transporter metallochaperone ArsD [Nitriliruptoraceae bacterium]